MTAARQPEMRFVMPKTAEQQSRAAVFRCRERLVHQRTADVNALRALLYEHEHVFPQGIRYLNPMTALVEDKTTDLHALIREECLDLLAKIAEKTARIIERNKKLKALAAESDKARQLQTMPGVGPLTVRGVHDQPLPARPDQVGFDRGFVNEDSMPRSGRPRGHAMFEPIFALLPYLCRKAFGSDQRLFFVCESKLAQKPPDRIGMRGHRLRRTKPRPFRAW